jgi:hypothetical protein
MLSCSKRLHRNIFGADVESLMLVLYTESSQICRLLKTKRKSTKGQTLTDKALQRRQKKNEKSLPDP